MARKKTVSISRKPSNADAVGTPEPSQAAADDNPPKAYLPPSLEPSTDIVLVAPPSAPTAPQLGRFGRVVYGTVYCISYGVVFSAILIGQFIPGSRVVGQAMLDGGGSARRSLGH
jgi:hypothetical protein